MLLSLANLAAQAHCLLRLAALLQRLAVPPVAEARLGRIRPSEAGTGADRRTPQSSPGACWRFPAAARSLRGTQHCSTAFHRCLRCCVSGSCIIGLHTRN